MCADLLLRLDSDCPHYDELVEELRDTAEIREVEEANKQLYEYLTQNTGRNVTSVEDIEYLYDALFIEVLSINNSQLKAETDNLSADSPATI